MAFIAIKLFLLQRKAQISNEIHLCHHLPRAYSFSPPQKRGGLLRWAMLNTAESVLKDGVLGI